MPAEDVPPSTLALSSFSRVDYADAFSLATDVRAGPELWARAIFGDTPDPAERFVWRGLLGLRLGKGASPETVAGWRICSRDTDWIRLEADSWMIDAELLVQVAHGRVRLCTFLHYRKLPGRIAWTPLSAVHRRLAPGLLTEGEGRVRPRAHPAP